MSDVPADESLRLDSAVASLLAESSDLKLLMRVLARELSATLGARVEVKYQGGLLRRSAEVRSLAIAGADQSFRAEATNGGISFSIAHFSAGIRLRSENVELPVWLRSLVGALEAEARHDRSAREALEAVLAGRS